MYSCFMLCARKREIKARRARATRRARRALAVARWRVF